MNERPVQVPEEHARRLRALGSNPSLAEVSASYAPSLRQQPRAGVIRRQDLAYGPHPRQRLDVYHPAGLVRPRPVLALFHGGGFVRGDKLQRENVGYWAARAGCVAVLANYRLAPECRWPSGPEDVVAVWRWAREHVAPLGGDPDRVILLGESAGAAHVAAASLWRQFQPPGWHIAGAALLSGPYNARLEGLCRAQFGIPSPDPRNEAYLSPDSAAWDAASIVDHVDAAPFPLLIAYAQRDLLQMQVQAGELFARLASRHGFAPELVCWSEHNHFSPGYSLGTTDESVGCRLLEFARRAAS